MAKKINTKEQILEKSLNLFSLTGYDGTSIRHIANAVGIRESAIYNHYKSKEEILKAIVNEFKTTTAGANILSEDLIDKLDKPAIFMRRFCTNLLKQWNGDNEKKFFRLLLMEQFREIKGINLSVTHYFDESRSMWEMIFGQMIKHKVIAKGDPKIIAAEFIAPLYFIRMEYLVSEKKDGLKKALNRVNEHVEFFLKALQL